MENLHYNFIVDLNERGFYLAHVEDANEKHVFTLSNENIEEDEEGNEISVYGRLSIVEDGYMKHVEDMEGLTEYLIDMLFIPKDSIIYYKG